MAQDLKSVVALDLGSAQRIEKAVKRVENEAVKYGDPFSPLANTGKNTIWAKITSSAVASSINQHAWTEQVRTATGFQDSPSPRTGTTTTRFAVMPDNSRVPDNTYVRLSVDYLSTGLVAYTIIGSPLGVIFHVGCATNSGSLGDASNRATMTYNITPLGGGGTIGANLTPEMSPARIYKQTVTAGTVGGAYFNGSNVVLAWVNELGDSELC